MSKHFIIDKELVCGVVRSEEDHMISFDKEEKEIRLSANASQRCIPFTQIRDYADTLNALVFALRDSIDEAIEEAQDNSLPE